jgi:hypothetical protein
MTIHTHISLVRPGMRAIIAIAALGACSSHRDPAPIAAPPLPLAAPAGPAAMDSTPGLPGSQDLAPLSDLGTRMTAESTHRPEASLTVERLFAALAERGVRLASQHQVLAAVAHASYCALGVTPESVAIAVCEYASHSDAEAGRALLDRQYRRLVPDAVRAVNGNTLVTIANASTHRELRDRVLVTFAAL